MLTSTVGALLLAACGSDSSSSDSVSDGGRPTVRIGVVGPESGSAPQFWTDAIRPVELAADELGEKYGINVEIVEADDGGTPEGASQAIQTLLNSEDVDALFGPPQSGNALQVAEVVQRTGRPWLLPAQAPALINPEADPNWAFRTNYASDDLATIVGDLLFAGGNRVGVVHSTDAYGQTSLEAVQAYAEANGLEIAAEEAIQPGSTDFAPSVRRLEEAGVTAVFMGITAGADTATVTRAMVQEGFRPELKVTNATILADFEQLAEPAQWENLVFVDTRRLAEGAMAEISADYEKRYGEAPILPTNVYSFFAGMDAYLQAVAQVGDADDYDAVREAMESVPAVSVRGESIASPFSADDHELYEAEDQAAWYVYGFDAQGSLSLQGTVADCLGAAGC
ncbi:ABC transporter substrate-binding protein [Parafrankia elaeagni]|uniref:ABC transporter substrate-binding protein n=1 Tax=Parafrankia elaeagni TaxID=222534 RepID=UPI0018A82292|nr:ABC transporter substrate-binding protein [Parafrankia elaeagni]